MSDLPPINPLALLGAYALAALRPTKRKPSAGGRRRAPGRRRRGQAAAYIIRSTAGDTASPDDTREE